jgi:hypothetical protein
VRIDQKKNEVNLRRHDSLIWDETSVPAELYAYDSILTLDCAIANIAGKSGESLYLKPNTLVSFDSPTTG